MVYAFCYALLPPCIHSHATAKYSKSILKIPEKYIPRCPLERQRIACPAFRNMHSFRWSFNSCNTTIIINQECLCNTAVYKASS